MSEKTAKKNVDEKIEPVLIIGTVPALNDLARVAWSLAKPASEQLAAMEKRDYEAYDVFRAIWFGHAFMFVAYMCDSKADAEFAGKSVEAANVVVSKYLTLKRSVDFVGFAVVRMDDKAAHIWQAFMTEKYRGTDAFDKCMGAIEAAMVGIGAPKITFSTMRKGLGDRVERMGYREGLTVFHKALAKKEPESGLLV